jgi:hypothetical protein
MTLFAATVKYSGVRFPEISAKTPSRLLDEMEVL